MSNAIETSGLGYRAGRDFEIRDLSLNVPAGSIYGFLGPNGAGKTTTIRLLLGMVRPDAGAIRLLGHPVPEEVPAALARVGYVPERPHLYPSLTIGEAMRYHAAFFPRWDNGWADRLSRLFELPVDRVIGRLSKGETGKLMILLALAQRPELLVLDEPTDGLDPMIRRDALSAVLDYVGDTGATVFISSHLVHELERICDWVGVLDHGRLVTELPIATFKSGVKRLRVVSAPAPSFSTGGDGGTATLLAPAPFTVLSRVRDEPGTAETWIVRGWDDAMREYFDSAGMTLREVVDLDLEEVFVELLRGSRQESGEVVR